MRNSLLAFGIVISTMVLINAACTPKTETTITADKRGPTTMDQIPSKENPYLDLRSMALNAPANQFEIDDSTEPKLYGIVLDWNLGDGVATIAAFKTGDASMYLSSGGGVIGGIGHDNVKLAAQSLVRTGKKFLEKSKRSDDNSVASEDTVKFFFLTTKGRFVSKETLENFDNGASQWLELFEKANKLIAELRSVGDLN